MSDPRKLTDLRLMQIKEKMLHGEFVYSHGLDLLDHIAALSAELAQVRGELAQMRSNFHEAMDLESRARAERDRFKAALEWIANNDPEAKFDEAPYDLDRAKDIAREALEGET